MFKINIDNFKQSLKVTFKRLPVAMLFSVSVFILLLVQISFEEEISRNAENLINKGILTLSIFFFFSIGIYLFSEALQLSRVKKWLYQIITVVFTVLYYFSFEENLFQNPYAETFVYIIMTLIGIIAFVFFAPFIIDFVQKHISQRKLYVFSYAVLIRVLMAVIAGLATMLLGFIALNAIFTLFDLKELIDEGNMFARWVSFALALFAPIFFLVNLPTLDINKDEKIQDNKFYSFLINYIGLPAITIYFIILYSYTIKVLINFSDWPNGEVAWMVIGFSFFGYLVYFASYIFVEKFKTAQIFRKIFPLAVLAQTLMLFYAIFLRINQYDITINRYLVVGFGVWLFFISVYFIVSKKKYLGTIFYSLLIIILLISIGPWSVYTLPEKRQQTKLKQYLEEAKILDNNEIIALEKYSDIPGKLSGQIYGSIEYLCNFHGCDTLNDVFAKEIIEIKQQNKIDFEKRKEREIANIKDREYSSEEEKNKIIQEITDREYSEMRNWSIVSALTEKIKVQRYYDKKNVSTEPRFFTYEVDYSQRNDNIKISGYDYYMELKPDINIEPFDHYPKMNLEESYYAVLSSENEKLFIYHGALDKILDNKEEFIVETFSLNNEFKQILEKFKGREGTEQYQNNYIKINNPSDLIFDLKGESFDARLQLYKVSIKNPEYKEIDQAENNDKESNGDMPMMTRLNSIDMQAGASGRVLLRVKNAD